MLDDDYYRKGWSLDNLLNLELQLECELPNSNLHNFRGRVGVKTPGDAAPERIVPIQMSQMLLRGTVLKNSTCIYGLVVYTGSESRIQMNSAAAPHKVGSFDHFLNMQVAILIAGQATLCIFCAELNFVWRETEVRGGSQCAPLDPRRWVPVCFRVCPNCTRSHSAHTARAGPRPLLLGL